jgi:hypothetical protein
MTLNLPADTWRSLRAIPYDIVAGSSDLAAAALVVAVLLTVVFGVMSLAALGRAMASARRRLALRRIARTERSGPRILCLVDPRAGRRSALRFVSEGLDDRISGFLFGGRPQIFSLNDPGAGVARAQQRLEETGCDVAVWVERRRREIRLVCLRVQEPAPAPAPAAARYRLPRRKGERTPSLAQALAFAIAVRAQPAIGRPQDFRPERLQPFVEALLSLLDPPAAADPGLLAEIYDTAMSGSLQMALAGERVWIDRTLAMSEDLLKSIVRSDAPERWLQAKLCRGRALRLRGELMGDNALLRQAVADLSEALEAMRAEPRVRIVEAAAQAVSDAQKILSGKRRFSILGGGI